MNITNEVELTGLDGSNPLAFLAALGTLYLLSTQTGPSKLFGDVKMSWGGTLDLATPRLTFERTITPDELASILTVMIKEDFTNGKPWFLYNDIIAIDAGAFRELLCRAIRDNESNILDLFSGFGSDAVIQTQGKKAGCIEPTHLSFANGQSMRYLLNAYADLVAGLETKSSTYPPIDSQKIHAALFNRWSYADEHKELRWDPSELRLAATPSPSNGTVHGANVLAFWSLALLPTVPSAQGIQTAAVHAVREGRKERSYFVMPRWKRPLSLDVVRSVMVSSSLRQRLVRLPSDLSAMGIANVSACEIITVMKANYFAESIGI